MSNSVFQSVMLQLKDVSDRTFGVMDTDGFVVSCTDPALLGERWSDAALRITAGGDQMAGMNNSMMIMMPIMSIWISFIVPAGVGIYWLISNILSVIQSVILNKIMNPAEAVAKAKAEAEEAAARERAERIEKKRKAREEAGIKSADEAGLSQKEIARRKLAAARKRDAERYGDEFVDVTDDDVNVK